ncbi:5-formyltetrahydrofolate cyclo-ligase [Clostridium tetani]|uniref:5-formyltetrahydrofolate cyclo-ligase n=1 Tax=Clostridium tetani TaxID=1513 RepID=A0A4Q0VF52_CLOTA|nr:5-formyltetrahydrofolate cyclo-ligase [Clostridium tetani]RXI50605.1 5-formyltetrahydrofolate cyclo-ligase [Clostridium tetani]BDR66624.1 5-formyltetrahydrofolate cyclo-ligase [Clostridium tetani]BDR72114.1 5-formyltetrahydrofolate cyclo-ligase [Clostridium tetani]BDR80596.1 5-formyltetrahydrofolate cyclo-ligase [Clostridium tetani]BDR89052.1 5-formyltetrahydrofolate cyclo-ligase [Clostridium tetani]
MMDKKELREKIMVKRDGLSKDKINEYDGNIFERVIESKYYKEANCIFIFVSYKSEVHTHEIIKRALKDNKRVCVPKIISLKDGMEAIEIKSFSELKPGEKGILEPVDFSRKVDSMEIDIVFTPGLAFDNKGGRLGYGGGFYDKFFKRLKKDTPKVGLAYSFQIVDFVPMYEWDVRINDIIVNE